ncbi:MAG: hypothetical protein HYV60_08845 [Planctomycetia bacterium]|nr:hypothetical protein [Planctomycetia bacterium]
MSRYNLRFVTHADGVSGMALATGLAGTPAASAAPLTSHAFGERFHD